VVNPETIARLLACARVSAAISEEARWVAPERRDEFIAASAQVMGCVLGIPAHEVSAVCTRATTEFDAAADAKKAAQS
jgi:hypothetical protein